MAVVASRIAASNELRPPSRDGALNPSKPPATVQARTLLRSGKRDYGEPSSRCMEATLRLPSRSGPSTYNPDRDRSPPRPRPVRAAPAATCATTRARRSTQLLRRPRRPRASRSRASIERDIDTDAGCARPVRVHRSRSSRSATASWSWRRAPRGSAACSRTCSTGSGPHDRRLHVPRRRSLAGLISFLSPVRPAARARVPRPADGRGGRGARARARSPPAGPPSGTRSRTSRASARSSRCSASRRRSRAGSSPTTWPALRVIGGMHPRRDGPEPRRASSASGSSSARGGRSTPARPRASRR